MPKVGSKSRKKRVEKKSAVESKVSKPSTTTAQTSSTSSRQKSKRKKDETKTTTETPAATNTAEVVTTTAKLAKRKIERKIKQDTTKAKRAKKTTSSKAKKQGDYRNILEYKSDKDMRNVEKRLRERLKKKRQEEVDEEEELLKSTSESSQSSSDSNSGSAISSSSSSEKEEEDEEEEQLDEEVKEALDMARRASIIASSNINPSDGDDEGSKSGSHSSKESGDAGGSLDSNRSDLSSNSKKSSLTRARNQAAKKEDKEKKKKDDTEFVEYDLIERQLLADQEKELEYLNGLDQPINKADLPLLCPDENHNGPPMNEPMKLRIQRLKRTKVWVRNIPTVAPLLRDEVDEYIEQQKKKKTLEVPEIEFESIFDPVDTAACESSGVNEKTLEMESNLKLAILKRLNQQQST